MAEVVIGLASLQKRLARMPVEAKTRTREALLQAAEEISQAQKALAQRSRHTGELIDGLKVKDGEHELQVKIVSEAFYSRWVEFGTVRMRAEPFFFPAYRLFRKKAKSKVRSAIRKAARDAARA